MNAQTAKTNRTLFLVLFAALATDLYGRLGPSHEILSADLASSAVDEDCARLIKDGIERSGKEAGCVLNYNNATTEARVRKATKTAAESLDWSSPVEEPAAPSLRNCNDIKAKDKTQAEKDKATKAKKACLAENKRKQDDYEAARRRADDARKPKTEDVFEVEVVTTASDCADCQAKVTVQAARTTSPLNLARMIREQATKQLKEVADLKVARKKAEDEEKKKKADQEKLAKDMENCLRGADGKVLKSVERLKCDADKLDSLEGKEASARFASVRSQLRQLMEGGTDEERAEALAISEDIARNKSLPRNVQETARVMAVAGKYNDRILKISADLARTPENSPARMFHMQRLFGLQSQMQLELGSAINTVYMRSQMSGRGAETLEELMYWQATLTNSMALATARPQSLLDQSGFAGRGRLGIDIDQYGRTLRGLPGDPLVNREVDFRNLLSSGNRYIDQQIANIGRSSQLTQLPGGPNQFTPGAGPQFQQQGIPGQQFRPGTPGAAPAPASQPRTGVPNGGIPAPGRVVL